MLCSADSVFPLLTIVLPVNYSIDSIVAQLRVNAPNMFMDRLRSKRTMIAKYVYNSFCEHRVHAAARKSKSNQVIIGCLGGLLKCVFQIGVSDRLLAFKYCKDLICDDGVVFQLFRADKHAEFSYLSYIFGDSSYKLGIEDFETVLHIAEETPCR